MLGFLPRMPKTRPTPSHTRFLERSSAATAESTLPLAVPALGTAETFGAISTPAGDLVANGRVAKFLIDRRNPVEPTVISFVNGNFTDGLGVVPDAAKFHYFFGQVAFNIPELLEDFNALTYFTLDKRYIAGNLSSHLFLKRFRRSRSTVCNSIPKT